MLLVASSWCLALACGERDETTWNSGSAGSPGASSSGPEASSGAADGTSDEPGDPSGSGPAGDGTSGGPSGSDGDPGGSATTPDTASDAGSSVDSDTSDDVRFDIGEGGDLTTTGSGDGTSMEGCQKIDFLFVVDNSGSMGQYQTQLIGSFGPFIDTIYDTVRANDFQIMVVDSDADIDLTQCEGGCAFGNSTFCPGWCTTKDSLDLTCEGTLGAGEVAPYNNNASNAVCDVPDGKRYLTSALSRDEIKTKFACMAKVGTFGSGAELPMSAMVEAVTTLNQPGACNEGFVRRDAVLVVTVISDDYPVPATEDDASTVGSPQAWYDAVAQAKGGAQNVVMLGIINTADAICVSGAGSGPIVHPTQKFVDVIQRFGGNGFMGNICSPDYNAFFKEAVSIIDTACNEFVPPE